jgi:DnaJ-domain-containing protein 1
MLLHQAVLLTFVDGEQADSERQVLASLAEKLRIPAQEADAILTSGAAHAKSMLHLLRSN